MIISYNVFVVIVVGRKYCSGRFTVVHCPKRFRERPTSVQGTYNENNINLYIIYINHV